MHKPGQRRRSKFRNLGLWIWVLLAILVLLGTISRIVNGPRELPAPDQLSMAVSVVAIHELRLAEASSPTPDLGPVELGWHLDLVQ